MADKEKILFIIIAVLVILLLITNIEIKKAPDKKPRTEEHIKDCEVWKICDYRESLWGCTATECPEVYDCWEAKKNCGPPQTSNIQNLPECYVTTGEICANGFDKVDFYGSYPNSSLIQCCQEPHYVLQGIDFEIFNDILINNKHIQGVFDAYNCSFDISRKSYCTDIHDCYKRPDLKGCEEIDCNTCCFNTCTLLGCYYETN